MSSWIRCGHEFGTLLTRTSPRGASTPDVSADAADISDREDLGPLFLKAWHRHIAPDLSLHRIRTLGGSLKELEAQLDEAVPTARAGGVSWDKIGRAFGITRQGA